MNLPKELLGSSVELGAVTTMVDEPLIDGPVAGDHADLAADATHAVLTVHGVARFGVEDGRRIVVELDEDRGDDALTWMFGTVVALVLGQQGRCALHASTVDINGTAVAVGGRRKAGKSTTTLALAQRGARFVADDVTVLDLSGSGAVVEPFGRPVHVWPETAERLGVDVSEGRPVLPGSPKLALDVLDAQPQPLGAFVVITVDDSVGATRLSGTDALHGVRANTYRSKVVRDLWPDASFAWSGEVATRVPVYRISRPSDGWTVDEVATLVEEIAAGHSAPAGGDG